MSSHPESVAQTISVTPKVGSGVQDLPDIPPAPPGHGVRWRRAFRAFRALIDDPDDTAQAQFVIFALGERQTEWTFQRFLASPTAPALLRERPRLVDTLSNRSALAALPADSFGRAYLRYMEENHYNAQDLLDMNRAARAQWEREESVSPLDEIRTWFSDRHLLSHDLFHVLTGYGTDGVGEATLLAFSLGQVPGRAGAFLTFGAALEIWRGFGMRWLQYDYRAWQRGRRTTWLLAMPWEELLELRLETLRAWLRIAPAADVHRDGILRGDSTDRIYFDTAA